MWNRVSAEYAFKRGWKSPGIEETCHIISEFHRLVLQLKSKAGKGFLAEVRYEDLVTNPAGEIQRIYEELGLEFTTEFESEIMEYAKKSADYRKNTFELNTEDKNRINNCLKDYFECYGYSAV